MIYCQSDLSENSAIFFHDGMEYEFEINYDDLDKFAKENKYLDTYQMIPYGTFDQFKEKYSEISLEEYIEAEGEEALITLFVKENISKLNHSILQA